MLRLVFRAVRLSRPLPAWAVMRRSILVFSSLFPSAAAPGNGLFVRERMFRVADNAHVDMVVVSPTPWFPGQGIIRRFKKDYRPQPRVMEIQHGITVHSPRFLAFPFPDTPPFFPIWEAIKLNESKIFWTILSTHPI